MKKQFTNPTPIHGKPMTSKQIGKMLKGLYNKPEGKKKHRHKWEVHCDCEYCDVMICYKCGKESIEK